jgi:mono/diheme cytochrome c family protein
MLRANATTQTNSAPREAMSMNLSTARRTSESTALVRHWSVLSLLAALTVFSSCSDPSSDPAPNDGGYGGLSHSGGSSGEVAARAGNGTGGAQAGNGQLGQAGEGGEAGASALCTPVRSAHNIPARAALYARSSGGPPRVQSVSELVGRFDGFCAGCHRSPASQGNFSYSAESFSTAITSEMVDRILSPDGAKRMPPLAPFPIREDLKGLASDLTAWLEQGRPTVTFRPPAESDDAAAQGANGPFAINERVGRALTNLGDCIPVKEIVGANLDADDEAREARFAAIQNFKQLPKKLSETDLFTLDTETLARHNTIAIAPAYQLWSFDAEKLRHLHLPPGTSLQYDAATKNFISPENTRLYKTFTKAVTDKNGQVGYRKIETRLIVARQDVGLEHRAVFGTYIWNDDETEATLLEKPYVGTNLDDPNLNTYTFKDLIKPFVEDERLFAETLESVDNHSGNVVLRPLVGQKEYPVPGWHRCVQCHQGSPSKDFLLGLTPTELNRRPLGEGGVYEEVGPDELTQAQRLIDYGFVTGVRSPDEFIKLEDSAGERKPRNSHELRAQAYLVGNCSGCHNPRGYPTRLNPSLAELDFLPGGIVFGFPLEQRSPLRIPSAAKGGLRYLSPELLQRTVDQDKQRALQIPPGKVVPALLQSDLGPWNSLFFRNVQTPRTYGEQGGSEESDILYPHMPLHIPGIDCRAQIFLGSWAASIPYLENQATNPTSFVDSDTATARAAAESRVQTFLAQRPQCQPAQDLRDWGAEAPAFTDLASPAEIPDRAHWFEEDFTEVVGTYQPRNGKWESALSSQSYAHIRNFEPSAELKAFVDTEVPFDFWKDKPECDFSEASPWASPTDYWMEKPVRDLWSKVDDKGHPKRVYSTLPGAAIFGAICANCHGPRATAESNLASTIANLTGGTTRVANWSQGFFGPLDAPTSNLRQFEGSSIGENGAVKYMLFMALGGTEALIPPAALRQVTAALVASQPRPKPPESFATANMLQVAKEVCGNTLQVGLESETVLSDFYDPASGLYAEANLKSANPPASTVVARNGEYLLYQRLCAIGNPRPVRELEFIPSSDPKRPSARVSGYFDRNQFDAAGYVRNGTDENPYCVNRDSLIVPANLALCPYGSGAQATNIAKKWAERGALNAGFAVFSYLKKAFADPTEWRPGYDQCELRYPKR